MSLISNDDLFLCESGDEIRSIGDRCNIRPNCGDRSDERNCDQCKFVFFLVRTVQVGREDYKQGLSLVHGKHMYCKIRKGSA